MIDKMRNPINLLILLCWIAFAPCAVENYQIVPCDPNASLFKERKSYYYSYDLEHTAVSYNGETRFLSEIKCDIRVDAFGNCQYVLNTNDCKIFNERNDLHEQSLSFSKQMEKNPVLVTETQDGLYVFSAHQDEDISLLNIKRGIVSTFQTVPVNQLKEVYSVTTKRNGVQGICEVRYYRGWRSRNATVIRSSKPWRSCTLNQKYIENETVLNLFHQLNDECEYHFNDANDFYYASCTELPIDGITRYATFTHRFRRSLSFVKSASLVDQLSSTAKYQVTNINFENVVDPPRSNHPDWKKTVIKLIERMVELSDSPIESEAFRLFNGLVEILNNSNTLDSLSIGIGHCWGSPKCQSAETPYARRNQIRFGHIWRDALIQCGSTACLKAFKSFVIERPASMTVVLNDDFMDAIYYEWLTKGTTHLESIYSIFDICKSRNKNLCYLAFASNVRRYWKINSHKDRLPAKLKAIVENIIKPIERCNNASAEDSRLLLSLKMLSNIGEFAEVVEPDLINLLYQCATKPTNDWLISVVAVDAFRRMESSSRLYEHLLNIIKNPSLKQDIRANSYLVLVDKWGEKAASDIHTILKSVDVNIKTFIYSHIKAVLRAQDHVRIRLAEAFRKIVDDDSMEFFLYDSNKKVVSKYVEEGNFHILPITAGKENMVGYQFTGTHLYDGTSYYPSSLLSKLKMTVYGDEFDYAEVSYYSKGFLTILTKVLQNILKNGNSDEDSLSMIKLLLNPQSKTTKPDFLPYNLDQKIAKSLENIINKLSDSLNVQPSILLSANFFGEEAGYAGLHSILSYVLNSTSVEASKSIYRTNTEILRRSITIATNGGLPLKHFLHSDLMIVENSKLTHHDSNERQSNVMGINKDISLSSAVTVEVGTSVDLPGFYRKGFADALLASVSGALVADASMDLSVSGKKAFRLELQSKSKQALVVSKHCEVIVGDVRQFPFANKPPTPICNSLSKGIKFCKVRQFEGGTLSPFYFSYELQIPEKHPAVLQLKFNSEDNQTMNSTNLSLSVSGEGVHNLKQILNYNYAFDKTKEIPRLSLNSELLPHLRLYSTSENPGSDDVKVLLKGSFTPHFGFDYYVKKFKSNFEDGRLKSNKIRLTKASPLKNDVLGNHYVYNFVLSTSKGNFTAVYTKQQFPISSYYDLSLQFKCINDDAANWLSDIVVVQSAWEDPRTVKMDVHYETESFLDQLESGVPEDRTSAALQFPKYIIEVDSESSIVDEHSVLSTLNFTTHILPENTPELSYILSLFRKKVREEGVVVSKEILATLSVPHLKWIFSFDDRRVHSEDRRIVLKLQRKVNEDDSSEHQSNSVYYSIMSDTPPSTHEIAFDFNIGYGGKNSEATINILSNFNFTGFPWLNIKDQSEVSPTGNIQFKALIRGPSYRTNYSLYSNYINRALYGSFDISDSNNYHQLDLVDHSNATIFRQYLGLWPNYDRNWQYRVIYNFSSDVYTYFSQLITHPSFSNVDFSILAHSPEWNLLNVDLKQHVGNQTETMRMKHDLMDIEVDASWSHGYKKTFVFHSKTDGMPAMRWELNCKSIYKCVGQMNFTWRYSPTLYIVYELSPGQTEMRFTICRNKICKDIITDPDDFIFQAVFSLIEPFTVVRTITTDAYFMNNMKYFGISVPWSIFQEVIRIFIILSEPSHPIHKIYQHFVGISTKDSVKLLESTWFRVSQLLIPDVGVLFMPVLPGALYTGKTIGNMVGQLLPIPVGRSAFFLLIELRAAYDFLVPGFTQRPGPYPGCSSVEDLQSPIVLKSMFPIRLNPEVVRYWAKLRNEKTVIHDAFFDNKYSRVAMVIGNDAVRPFEGGLIKIRQPECPQLLAYDVDEQKFIIYKQKNWLHIIFSQSHLELSHSSGQLIVDSVQHELPFEHWTREFSVIRKGDLIILNTNYHLRIVCAVHETTNFCIFYTDLWKFGRLYGLLGNNTDVILAEQSRFYDQRYTPKFALTNESYCQESSNLDSDSENIYRPYTTDYSWSCRRLTVWDPTSPAAVCLDKVNPSAYYALCKTKGPDAVFHSYLAACGALGVPDNYGFNSYDYECEGNHRIGEKWKKQFYQRLVDVVFIVDQSLDSKYWQSYSKGLSNLAVHIKNRFAGKYSEIKFGLFGLRGPGILAHPTLYTTKSKFWGSAEDFSSSALSHLFSVKRSNESDNSSSDLFEAIHLVMDTAPFADQAARFIVLVTPQDPFDRIEVDNLYELVDSLKPRQTTLYTISNYKELPKGAFGIVGNQLSKPENLKTQIPTPLTGFKDLVPGHAARLAIATNGAVWSLSHLESGENGEQSEFYSEVAESMVNRAQQFQGRYLHCTCKSPTFLKSYSYCLFN